MHITRFTKLLVPCCVAVATSLAFFAIPAEAHCHYGWGPYGYYGWHHHDGFGPGFAAGAGVGLGLGLLSRYANRPRYYYPSYPVAPYYPDPYSYPVPVYVRPY